MTLYAAIDLNSNNSVLCVLDESDRIVFSKRLSNDLAKIEQALRRCRGEIQGAAVDFHAKLPPPPLVTIALALTTLPQGNGDGVVSQAWIDRWILCPN